MDNKILIGVFALIAGVYGWLLKHLSKKHICQDDMDRLKDSVQFKDVCEAERRRLDDCIESEVKRSTERYEALEKSIDELKQLVRNNGRG